MNETTAAAATAVTAPTRRAGPVSRIRGASDVEPAEVFPLTQLGILFALFVGIYWETFAFMVDRWINDESAQHGWLIMPIAGYIVWSKRDKLRALPMRSDPRGLYVVVLALFLHLVEKAFDVNGPSPISIPIFVAGAVWYFAGSAWLRELCFPIAYLIFMVPIPGAINQFVSFPLRLFATEGSKSIVHHVFGIETTGAGMNVQFWRPGTDHSDLDNLVAFTVADPCSGLHSLMAIKALHAITAYLSRLKLGWKWVLFWCALPISVAANCCRMVLIVLVSAYLDRPVAAWYDNTFGPFLHNVGLGGFADNYCSPALHDFGLHLFHGASPYILFIFVFLILISVGRLMEWATGARHRAPRPTTTEVAA